MAYLSGGDTWVDIPRLFGLAFTQPDKIHIRESHDPDWSYVLLLLQEMRVKFTDLSTEFDSLYEDILNYTTTTNSVGSSNSDSTASSSNDATVVEQKFHINPAAVLLLSEITDSMKLLSLRAQQVHALYQSRDPEYLQDKKELQRQARGIVHEAEKVSSTTVCVYYIYCMSLLYTQSVMEIWWWWLRKFTFSTLQVRNYKQFYPHHAKIVDISVHQLFYYIN